MFKRIVLSVAAPLALLVWSVAAPPTRADFLYVDTESTVVQVTSSGQKNTFASGIYSYGLTTNSSGDVFIGQYDKGTVVEMNSLGGVVTTYGGFSGPLALASDSSGNIFVANNGGGISEITSGGTVKPFSTYSGNDVYGMAVDSNDDVFVSKEGSDKVVELDKNGNVSNTFTGFNTPWGLAIGPNGDLFVANFGNGTVSEITSLSTPGGEFVQNISGFQNPTGLAFDSNGNLFVGEYYSGDVKDVNLVTLTSTIYTSNVDGVVSLAFGSEPSGPNPVPEPSSLTLLGLGLASLAAYRWRRLRIAY